MKIYYLNNETKNNGSLEFRANGDTYALVSFYQDQPKTIMLNQREVLSLYQALQDEILKGVK